MAHDLMGRYVLFLPPVQILLGEQDDTGFKISALRRPLTQETCLRQIARPQIQPGAQTAVAILPAAIGAENEFGVQCPGDGALPKDSRRCDGPAQDNVPLLQRAYDRGVSQSLTGTGLDKDVHLRAPRQHSPLLEGADDTQGHEVFHRIPLLPSFLRAFEKAGPQGDIAAFFRTVLFELLQDLGQQGS